MYEWSCNSSSTIVIMNYHVYMYEKVHIYHHINDTSGGTKFMLLEALQDIHLGQPWIKFPSPFCAAVVGRSNISPSFKSIRFYSFWGWKCVRDTTQLLARILRGKVLQKKKPNMFTVGSSTSETFVLPVCTNQFTTYIIPHTYLIYIYIYTFIHTY